MNTPLLDTKLFAPRRRRGLVARPQLTARLQREAAPKLTLVSAPAGFGKTMLLAEWRAARTDESSVAWLSLDAGDNDPELFWAQLIAALQSVAPGVGASALSLLATAQPPMQAVLATLLNDLAALEKDVALVLDDYHAVDARDIQEGMAFLLDHLPPQVHLVIATRADPALPLSRLRAQGELVEIRAADLRFTPDEAAAYLNDEMGLELSAGDVAALEGRTEGWIAALQLAGLSMQGRDDTAGFIAGFAGDDRYVVDYLVEEVLHRQPEHIRSFLLQTSILGRLSGPLCDAVTGGLGGRAMLEALDRANLFLVPLDDRRRWYRYHHLFADVLQARLMDERPDGVAELHRRASEWYEGAGERAEAIRHAMAGGDFGRAADLVELAIPATTQARQEATLRRWLEALPDDVIRVRPVLSNGYAGSILVRSEVAGVEERLQDAERWMDAMADGAERPPGMVVADEAAFRNLPSGIEAHRAGQARILGDVGGTMAHARRAADLVREDDHVGRGAAAALLGLALWTSADLDAAYRNYADAMASFETAGYRSDMIGCAMVLADIRIAQGRLNEAMRIYERGLEVVTGQGPAVLRGAADMHVGISDILRERNDLEGARDHLLKGAALGEENGLPQNPYRSKVATARLRQADGDLDGSLECLREAERVYVSDFFPDVRPLAAQIARVWIAQGKTSDARGWARERRLSAADDLSYLHEFEHITLARLLLAEHADGVLGLLARLLEAAHEGGRTGSVIEILLVQALALQSAGDQAAALAALERAVALMEPEGYVRLAVDDGPPMAALLRLAAKRRNASPHARVLLAAVTTDTAPATDQRLVEPLSERELEVLRLLQSDLDGPGIASELVVSLNTVRTHTKNIYAKLGVNSRREAVRRASELELLSRSRPRGRRPTA